VRIHTHVVCAAIAACTAAVSLFLDLDVLGGDKVEVDYTPSFVAKGGTISVGMERVVKLGALACLVEG
jgi:hypothetical protein